MDKIVEEFRIRFKKALSIRNMKPSELSEITSISKSTIRHYMSLYTKTKSDKLYSISKALDVSETWLMGYDVPMEYSQMIIGEEIQQILFQISKELQIPYNELLHIFISQKNLTYPGIEINKETLTQSFKNFFKAQSVSDNKKAQNEAFSPEIRAAARGMMELSPEDQKTAIEMINFLSRKGKEAKKD